MELAVEDIIPISQARARLPELADDVARHGGTKLLTRNGEAYAAIVCAQDVEDLHRFRSAQRLANLHAVARALPEIIGRRGQTVADFKADAMRLATELKQRSSNTPLPTRNRKAREV